MALPDFFALTTSCFESSRMSRHCLNVIDDSNGSEIVFALVYWWTSLLVRVRGHYVSRWSELGLLWVPQFLGISPWDEATCDKPVDFRNGHTSYFGCVCCRTCGEPCCNILRLVCCWSCQCWYWTGLGEPEWWYAAASCSSSVGYGFAFRVLQNRWDSPLELGSVCIDDRSFQSNRTRARAICSGPCQWASSTFCHRGSVGITCCLVTVIRFEETLHIAAVFSRGIESVLSGISQMEGDFSIVKAKIDDSRTANTYLLVDDVLHRKQLSMIATFWTGTYQRKALRIESMSSPCSA